MKASELRIGNYFQSNIIQQVEISHLEFLLNDSVDHSAMKPIPLTEEWLLKFGFEKKEYIWVKADLMPVNIYGNDLSSIFYMGFQKEWDKDKTASIVGISQNIKYVHELQNLYFALTANELEING